MEEMGMTDAQWKDNLRMQLENWEDLRDMALQEPDSDNKERMLRLCDRNITRINKGLQD